MQFLRRCLNKLLNLLAQLLRLIIKLYGVVFSPLLHAFAGPGFGCRYTPTCSDYAQQALEQHGLRRGSILTVKRLCRCHPFAKIKNAGFDPIPSCDTWV